MSAARGFAPIAGRSARVLILGTLPGRASLAAAQYYAQPRNAFWPLMGELFDAGPDLSYTERTARLVGLRIAVWDVCAAAERAGSLDASIARETILVNDFHGFFAAHPAVRQILFNGKLAAQLYQRRVLPDLPARWQRIRLLTLPSTSPAHAGMPFAEKKRHWQAVHTSLGSE
ncbi:MAG: DNA-deoxyinosine glycosylase [Steroidobacterales bacterium]